MADDFFPASDDLDAVITANVDPARAAQAAAAEEAQVGFVETCPKCHGTGKFRSYTGRVIGNCFHCRGHGKKTFKQAREVRERNRVQARERKSLKLAAGIAKFKLDHPRVWRWMDENVRSDRPFEFAVNLHQALITYGHLTDNQLSAAYKCVAKREERVAQRAMEAAERQAAAPAIDLAKITDAFQNASQTLQKPVLRFAGLVVSKAPLSGRNAGSLYVRADGEYVGKITDGKFMATRECSPEVSQRVLEACADPRSAAVAYGRQTGSCSCCGRGLTNQQSIDAGIGPICASKYGW